MLLLVVQAQRQDGCDAVDHRALGAPQERLHALVHRVAVGADLAHGGAREVAALGARVARAERLVVAVEEEVVLRVERRVVRDVLLQDEALEEPRRVRDVPARGAGLGHALQYVVLDGQRRAQAHGLGADVAVAREQLGGGRGDGLVGAAFAARGVGRIGGGRQGSSEVPGGLQILPTGAGCQRVSGPCVAIRPPRRASGSRPPRGGSPRACARPRCR